MQNLIPELRETSIISKTQGFLFKKIEKLDELQLR